MSKDNAKNNYSSTNYAKNLINFLIKRKKMHLQENGFKGLKETFTNNGLYYKNYQQITHFSLSFHHGKIHDGKINLGLRVLYLNSKVQNLIMHINKQNNILKLTIYIKTKLFNSKQK
jgi:hypothetical protein